MTNQKGLAPVIIVLIFVALIVGGVLAYRHWTSPVRTQEFKTEWSGTITSVNIEEGLIEAQDMNQTIRAFVSSETIIVDKIDNPLSFNDLKEGDFILVSGTYQMAGKMTPDYELAIVAKRIKVLGECKPPENQENCLSNCTEISKPVSVSMFIDVKSFDLDNKTFEGQTRPEGENVKVLTTDSTKFYRTAAPDWQKEYFTFSEFYALLKNWSGPSWPFSVKGILEKENIINAEEVFMIAQ